MSKCELCSSLNNLYHKSIIFSLAVLHLFFGTCYENLIRVNGVFFHDFGPLFMFCDSVELIMRFETLNSNI
jgi:hypothetical protein